VRRLAVDDAVGCVAVSEIIRCASAPAGDHMPFHVLWNIAVKVKHFQKSFVTNTVIISRSFLCIFSSGMSTFSTFKKHGLAFIHRAQLRRLEVGLVVAALRAHLAVHNGAF
jgi:hypothetical protein